MMEIFDMGKYDFFVWGSIGVFLVGVAIDLITTLKQHQNIKRNIKAQQQRKQP